MERLVFDDDSRYSAVEAAIHLARYAVAVAYCRGARVLDIACGEGYGAQFLASQGAAEVVGIEVDRATVERATHRYGSENVSFQCADAVRVDELLDANSFDLVVSLETIEHLSAPEQFLRALRKVARPEAVLIVSCPNDHWYFPDPSEKNPYHLRKYRFEAFRQLSEAILGPANQWLLGGPVMGFGTVPLGEERQLQREKTQRRMHHSMSLGSAFAVPAEDELELLTKNSSYFVGVWGAAAHRPDQRSGSAVIYPLSMDAFHPAFQPAYCRQLESRNQVLEAHIVQLEEALATGRLFRRYLPDWLARLIKRLVGRREVNRERSPAKR
ncbi:class I SAM-dependent methyltransferase [Lamprobacter modestohalophilus]|uniref:class I SAM-dependent methyltransferase n=1 Tax=Lamprobacter modestohalophilus TaxID=1064514 RepID=UPI002ADEB079|nr:class I SAM-dependent methyltransferase [Lamprobacter modestohalophilus]MEA1051479.1 class I SAM-dependent methyltransferase [Lamprobacter modestohalophilus]